MRVLLQRRASAAAALLVLAAAPALAADGAAIRADAGLAGIVREGRWTTVTVTIENTGPALSGELAIEIGSARAVSSVEAGSPSRQRVEMHLRVPSGAEPVVIVTFAAMPPLRVPVRLASGDTPVRLCVERMAPVSNAECAATLDAASLPRSWRGYDAADEVRIGTDVRLDAPQQAALARWRAIRHWADSTNMVPPPAPPLSATAGSRARVVLAAYVVVLFAACAGAPLMRFRAPWPHAAAVGTIVVASAAVLADGRVGSTTNVVVHDATLVRSGAGYAGAAVSARGIAAFPAASRVELSSPGEDGAIDVAGRRKTIERALDAAGRPVVRLSVTKGERVSFETEGFTADPFLSSELAGERLTITNKSAFALTQCSLPSGSQPQAVDRLDPGASATAVLAAGTLDPVVACTIEGRIETIAVGGRTMRHSGTATLLYDLRPIEVVR